MAKPGGFGSEFYGDPFGAGGPLHVVRARAVESQTVRVVFDEQPIHQTAAGVMDALNPANYSFSVITGEASVPVPVGVKPHLIRGPTAGVEAGDERGVDVQVDRPMVMDVLYRVQVRHVRAVIGGALGAPTAAEFMGISKVKEVRSPIRRIDLTDVASDPFEGGLIFDDSGDVAPQGGGDALRKRILRRLVTPKGAFAFLPGYGVGLRLKQPMSTRMLGELKADVTTQIKSEPDIENADVEMQLNGAGVLTVFVRARTRAGSTVEARGAFAPNKAVVL